MRYAFFILLMICAVSVFADETERDMVAECTKALNSMDDNLVFETRRCKGRLTVTNDEGERVKEMVIYAKGYYTSHTKFVAPPRDKGTKYLRMNKGKKRLLYMYLPTAEKVIRISGHMLRQSMMGSDWSYEDALESPRLLDSYKVVSGKNVEVDGVACYEMKLKALRRSVTYQSRLLIMEKERFVPVRQEFYARGGKHLKTITFHDIKKIRNRYYPGISIMKNHLLRNSTSKFELYDLQFDVELPRGVFTKRFLEREG